MRPTVLLWDIDGTLISTAGVGRRAIVATFERRFGRGDVLQFPFDGMTDPVILRQGLEGLGFSAEQTERELAPTLAEYLTVLEDFCAKATGFSVHAGVAEALSLVGGRPQVAVGLGTGNVEAGARLKLERVGLNPHFSFGGYGSDHGDRARLLAVGAERGAARLGLPRGDCRVVVIGDTPKDIAAARAIGAECVAVATGSFKVDALLAHGATHAFENLAHPRAPAVLLGQHDAD